MQVLVKRKNGKTALMEKCECNNCGSTHFKLSEKARLAKEKRKLKILEGGEMMPILPEEPIQNGKTILSDQDVKDAFL